MPDAVESTHDSCLELSHPRHARERCVRPSCLPLVMPDAMESTPYSSRAVTSAPCSRRTCAVCSLHARESETSRMTDVIESTHSCPGLLHPHCSREGRAVDIADKGKQFGAGR